TRGGATEGDLVLVTGPLGGSAAALAEMRRCGASTAPSPALNAAYRYPEPQLHAGQALRGLASAAIDISDGLLADLGHLARASGLGAELSLEAIPLNAAAVARFGLEQTRSWALSAGDDYQLCFALAPQHLAELRRRLRADHLDAVQIGRLVAAPGVRVRDGAGNELPIDQRGFQHFGTRVPHPYPLVCCATRCCCWPLDWAVAWRHGHQAPGAPWWPWRCRHCC